MVGVFVVVRKNVDDIVMYIELVWFVNKVFLIEIIFSQQFNYGGYIYCFFNFYVDLVGVEYFWSYYFFKKSFGVGDYNFVFSFGLGKVVYCFGML